MLIVMMPIISYAYSENTHIYMYGSSKCPHCRAMDSFFSQNYSSIFSFCNMVNNKTCILIFSRLINLTGTGPYIPTIIVTKNNKVDFLFIGQFTNSTFWNKMINSNIQQNRNSIPVYAGFFNGSAEVIKRLPISYGKYIIDIINNKTVSLPYTKTPITLSNHSGKVIVINKTQAHEIEYYLYQPNPLLVKIVIIVLSIIVGYVIYVEFLKR